MGAHQAVQGAGVRAPSPWLQRVQATDGNPPPLSTTALTCMNTHIEDRNAPNLLQRGIVVE
jgi:hypothetical protein